MWADAAHHEAARRPIGYPTLIWNCEEEQTTFRRSLNLCPTNVIVSIHCAYSSEFIVVLGVNRLMGAIILRCPKTGAEYMLGVETD